MTEVEREHPEIMAALAFADDMVLRGQIGASEMKSIIDTFEAYGLYINKKKTKSFYHPVANGIGKNVKTFKYLGLRVRSNGKSFDTIGVEDNVKKSVAKLRWISRKNPLKAYNLYLIYI